MRGRERSISHGLCCLSIAAATGSFVEPARAATFSVGVLPGCTHAELQDAIAAAELTAEPDVIRLTDRVVTTARAYKISTDELTIRGGYASCTDPDENPSAESRTALVGDGTRSVLTIRNATRIVLENLVVTGGDGDAGGGIDFVGFGRPTPSELSLAHVDVRGNLAVNGGGLAFTSAEGPGFLRLGDGVVFDGNEAAIQGGGVFLYGDVMLVSGHPGLRFTGNTARDGGALAMLSPASAMVGTSHADGVAAFDDNGARTGGAFYVDGMGIGGVAPRLWLYSIDDRHPMRIARNHATHHGGALFVTGHPGASAEDVNTAEAQVCARHIVAEENEIELLAGGDLGASGAFLSLGGGVRYDACESLPLPSGAIDACSPEVACDTIAGHRLGGERSPEGDEAILFVADGAHLGLSRVRVVGNEAPNLVRVEGRRANPSHVSVRDSLIVRNTFAADASTGLVTLDGASVFELTRSTVAENGNGDVAPAGTPTVLRVIDDALAGSPAFDLRSSIVHAPGATVADVDVLSPTRRAEDLLVAALAAPFLGVPSIIPGDPAFASADSFVPSRASLAVDFAAGDPPFETDLAGRARGFDHPDVPNFRGPVDLGAFELVEPSDALLRDGFE